MADPKSAPPPPSSYVNLMQVVHTDREFFFSFAQAIPETSGMAHLVSRVITTPGHAKAMLKALEENIRKYEDQFGAIPEQRTVNPHGIQ